MTVLDRPIGYWYPAGVPATWSEAAMLPIPAPRPGPENPPADSQAGDVRTQAQIGAPSAEGFVIASPPSAPLAVEPDFDRYFSGAPFDGVVLGEGPKREVIHDPGFNSKGSRAVPKTGGRK